MRRIFRLVSSFDIRVSSFCKRRSDSKRTISLFLTRGHQLPVTSTVFPESNEMISCTRAFCGYVASMDWQQLVALAIVAITAGLFIVARLLAIGLLGRRKFSFERDTHCGCAASGSSAPQSSIVFHARKGQRPEVLVKMR